MSGKSSFVREYPHFAVAGLFTLLLLLVQLLLEGGGPELLRRASLFFAVAALVLIFVPMWTFRRYGRVPDGATYMEATVVVERGLFGLVRHPQYLGYIFLNLTFMLLSQHWLAWIFGAAAIVFFYLHAVDEERKLAERFGEAYLIYMERIPRFNFVAGAMRALCRRIQRD